MLLSLREDSEAKDALARLAVTANDYRTQYFEITNNASQFILTLVLAEGYQEAGQVPQGYQSDTGLTVTGTTVVPGTSQKGILQPQINVLVTFAKCSLHWKRNVEPYDEGDLSLSNDTAPAGQFFEYVGWTVSEQSPAGTRPALVAKRRTSQLK